MVTVEQAIFLWEKIDKDLAVGQQVNDIRETLVANCDVSVPKNAYRLRDKVINTIVALKRMKTDVEHPQPSGL